MLVAASDKRAVIGHRAHHAHDRSGTTLGDQERRLAGTPHRFGTTTGGEIKSCVQSMSERVAIEHDAGRTVGEKRAFECEGDGGLARSGDARQPDRAASSPKSSKTMRCREFCMRHGIRSWAWSVHGDLCAISSGADEAWSVVQLLGFSQMRDRRWTHLEDLEAEAIHIFREAAAGFERPVLMYSIGKDSTVLLHLALKAFWPAKLPFPLLHIDTTWKFREMISFRDEMARKHQLDLRVHTNAEGLRQGISPITHGSRVHTDVMKTQALRQALEAGRYDAAIGGARRDEERSRAKERIFSFRDRNHRWDPRRQRPELWNIPNTRVHEGESMRVFPLSNWTELDVWLYILQHRLPVVPLYFAKPRPVVERDGLLIMRDDDRLELRAGERVQERVVRFRTLGCYPLSGAVESSADTLERVVEEMLRARTSERQGRLIDHDQSGSMEEKKREGYF